MVLLSSLFCHMFQIFETVFYIAIDHQHQAVVVAVRGTLSLNVSVLFLAVLLHLFISTFYPVLCLDVI